MVDPRLVRLSKHFLLSDFMGCNSVYARGLPNIWDDPSGSKLREAKYLATTMLEPILASYGPVSISYGYISPELSREVVAYQDPDKPSYHRFDDGAAVDFCAHGWVGSGRPIESAPIYLAHDIDYKLPYYSRMITYSESPFICIATKYAEIRAKKYRQAFYENRYTGTARAKPEFITKSKNLGKRREEHLPKLRHDWRGAGYPTYHGGGILQCQHVRVSAYTMLSDWLFNIGSIRHGIKNRPMTGDAELGKFRQAGALYDKLLVELRVPRLSITQGWAGPRLRLHDYDDFHWTDKRFAFVVAPPQGFDETEFADIVLEQEEVEAVEKMGKGQWCVVARFV